MIAYATITVWLLVPIFFIDTGLLSGGIVQSQIMQIKGKTVIVTGGASGLGRATVELFAASGAVPVIFDINAEGAERAAKAVNGCAAVVDVTDEQSVADGIQIALDRTGSIHACVNCAGGGDAIRTVSRRGPYPLDRFRRIIELNLIGTFNMVRLVAEQMQHNEPLTDDGERGAIVNVGSVAGIDGQIGQAAYSAAKAGIIGMTLPVARDLARLSIRINTICPGVFDTEPMQMAPPEMRDALAANAQFPKRLGRPVEFARLALSLIENDYLNGETIRLDAAMRMPPK